MKHAGSDALTQLSELLQQVRRRTGLREKKTGIFYRKSKSFLRFHEDPKGLFADLAIGGDFVRYPVDTPPQWLALLSAIDRALTQ